MVKSNGEMITGAARRLARTFSKPSVSSPELSTELSSNPSLMMLVNRIVGSGDPKLYERLGEAKSVNGLADLLVANHLVSSYRSNALGNLYNSGASPGEIMDLVARIISGEISTNDLEKENNSLEKKVTEVINKEQAEEIRKKISSDGMYHDTMYRRVNSGMSWSVTIALIVSAICAAFYLVSAIYTTNSFEAKRRDALRPVYEQVVAAISPEPQPAFKELISMGVDQKITEVPYTVLPSDASTNLLYLAAMDLPETSDDTRLETRARLINEKADALEAIIAQHPDTEEAYKAQYQKYILKSFNRDIFQPEEIIKELNSVIIDYANINALSTKRLSEFIRDYYDIQKELYHDDPVTPTQRTSQWIGQLIAATPETNVSFKLNYILASIYSGQASLLSVADEDKLSNISLPEGLIDGQAGQLPKEEVIRFYMESGQGSMIRASIANYSIAEFLLRDSNYLEMNSIPIEEQVRIGGYLEESVALAEGYKPYVTYWAPDAEYKLALIARNLKQHDVAVGFLEKLSKDFPEDALVTSEAADGLIKDINQQKVDEAEAKQTEEERRFDDWFSKTESDAGIK